MKKAALIFGITFISFLFLCQGLWAQRFYRNNPRAVDDDYFLNLTAEQREKIDTLERELDNELIPLFSRLRSIYAELDELELQRTPDQNAIEKKWNTIRKIETEIGNKEALYEEKIRNLLTPEQQALWDSNYYPPGLNFYGRRGFGRGYLGRGFRGYGQGYYGYGRGFRGYERGYYGYGRGFTRYNRGYYGYGRSRNVMGMSGRFLGRGAGRLGPGYYGSYGSPRYGRGPCGAGLGKWFLWDYRRGRRY